MITEEIEANYYSNIYKNLAIPISTIPFTKSQIGMLLPKKNKALLKITLKLFIIKNEIIIFLNTI